MNGMMSRVFMNASISQGYFNLAFILLPQKTQRGTSCGEDQRGCYALTAFGELNFKEAVLVACGSDCN
jgi:hypothetical protein